MKTDQKLVYTILEFQARVIFDKLFAVKQETFYDFIKLNYIITN